MIRVATVADCVQNPPRNGVACGRGFTVEHMSKGEQMQEQKMPVVAVVLAAGFGTRFDENNPKQLVSVGGKPIVCWSIEAFENNDRISDIIVKSTMRVRFSIGEEYHHFFSICTSISQHSISLFQTIIGPCSTSRL